jgi:predicted TIM-barrel fold metal-dependent hydrolase
MEASMDTIDVRNAVLARRDFLKGLAGAGAATLLTTAGSTAQAPAAARRIDVHQHYVSPDYYAALTRKNAVSPVAGFGTWRDYTPARHIEEMDKAGVATGMLSPTAPAVWFGDINEARTLAREMNEFATAKMAGAYRGRFGVFAVLPLPDVEGSLREIEYAFDTLKVDGVGLLTSYDSKWLGDPAFAPVFDELNRRRAIVYTHPLEAKCCPSLVTGVGATTLEYPTDTTRTIMSLIVSNTATRCPDIKFIFSHAGGTIVSIAGRFLGNQVTAESLAKPVEANSRLHHVRRFFYDTAGSANPITMQSLKLLVPVSQIVFGSDYPFGGGAIVPTVTGLESSGFSQQELRGVYRENALKFLPKYA